MLDPLVVEAAKEQFLLDDDVITKDWHVVRVIQAITAIDASPFNLVFAGGTALARAHRAVDRMSEDVDFKIVPTPAAPTTPAALRKQLGQLRDKVTASLLALFSFDPANSRQQRSRNGNRYTIYNLPFLPTAASPVELRPTIQVELTYAPLRLPPVSCPVSSFIAEATGQPPEVAAIACVSLTETAAEKFVSLTRRTAMELAGLSRHPDPALVRHIYDLHMLRRLINPPDVAGLAAETARLDAAGYANQYPAYQAGIAAETGKALAAFKELPVYRDRYTSFLAAMVYGEQPAFNAALASVLELAGERWQTEIALRPPSGPVLTIDIVDNRWQSALPNLGILCERAANASLARIIPDLDPARVEIGLTFTNDTAIQTLNRDYRQQDKPTNVLSFQLITDFSALPTEAPVLLGDLVLAYETVTTEATAQKLPLANHCTHLIVHGMLHLLGHDHLDDAAGDAMEQLEAEILASLGIANPYIIPVTPL